MKAALIVAGVAALAGMIRGLVWAAPRVVGKVRGLAQRKAMKPAQPRTGNSRRRAIAQRRLRRAGFIAALLLTGPRLFYQAHTSHAYDFLGWPPATVAACVLFALVVESLWISAVLGWDAGATWQSLVSFAAYLTATAIIQIWGAPVKLYLALPVLAAVWYGCTAALRDEDEVAAPAPVTSETAAGAPPLAETPPVAPAVGAEVAPVVREVAQVPASEPVKVAQPAQVASDRPKLTAEQASEIKDDARAARIKGESYDLAPWVAQGFAEATVRYHREKGYKLAAGGREVVRVHSNGSGS